MIESPPPNNVPVITDTNAIEYTFCDSETMSIRTQICGSCQHRTEEDIPKCSLNQLDINLMISVNEQDCLGDYW